MFTPL